MIYILAFLLCGVGIFVILRLSPTRMVESAIERGERKTLYARIQEVQKPKAPKGLKRAVIEARTALVAMKKGPMFVVTILVASGLAFGGAFVAISIGNVFLAPVMFVGMLFVPFWYVSIQANFYKRRVAEDLESALSGITTAYIRSENIITAVEENLPHLSPIVRGIFSGFISFTRVNANTVAAIDNMRGKADNSVFREWCDALTACQRDKTLKHTLQPIVYKLADLRIVSDKLNRLMYAPLQELIVIAVIVVSNIPMLYFLNRDWYGYVVHTIPGNIVIAALAAVIFVGFSAAIALSKPIDFGGVQE